jgi:hypothetical protein
MRLSKHNNVLMFVTTSSLLDNKLHWPAVICSTWHETID